MWKAVAGVALAAAVGFGLHSISSSISSSSRSMNSMSSSLDAISSSMVSISNSLQRLGNFDLAVDGIADRAQETKLVCQIHSKGVVCKFVRE